jgi:hypothetical protein
MVFAFTHITYPFESNTEITSTSVSTLNSSALPTWKVLRNIGYIILFPLLLFQLLMHRPAKDRKYTVFFEHAKLTLFTILLITFSYAIAGLATDIVVMASIISLR